MSRLLDARLVPVKNYLLGLYRNAGPKVFDLAVCKGCGLIVEKRERTVGELEYMVKTPFNIWLTGHSAGDSPVSFETGLGQGVCEFRALSDPLQECDLSLLGEVLKQELDFAS